MSDLPDPLQSGNGYKGLLSLLLRLCKDVYLLVGAVAVFEFIGGADILYPWMRIYVFVGTLLMLGSWIAQMALSNALASNPSPRHMLANTDKRTRTEAGGPNNLSYVASEMQGWREQMEDATLTILQLEDVLSDTSMFGIFDGHGGPMVSKICEQSFPLEVNRQSKSTLDLGTILEKSYREIDSFLQSTGSMKNMKATPSESSSGRPSPQASALFASSGPEGIVRENLFDFIGSTAVLAMIRNKEIVVANAGDSRAILCRNGMAVDLSRDHKPESPRERGRIENAGGRVSVVGPCHRVDFGLNLSRALGDFLYKRNADLPAREQKITAEPDIITETLSDQDEFIILGCDGIFELLTNQQVINFVRFRLKAGVPPPLVIESLLDECCSKDPQKTSGKGTDNESCILVLLPNRFPKS
jgi:protein phosphatase 1G